MSIKKNAQANDDHEVHTASCTYLPNPENCLYLGSFDSCHGAVKKAKKYYSQSNGCYYCSPACHTS